MRLVTYQHDNATSIGALRGDRVVDLSAVAPDMLSLIDKGAAGLATARASLAAAPEDAGLPLSAVTLLAPIPRPRKNIMCLGMNYAAHAYESARARGNPEVLPKYPVFFTKAPTTVNNPDAIVPLHQKQTDQLDWEVELAFVIGTTGAGITAAQAMDHIFGYTIINDVSAREIQNNHQQFFRGKSLDGCCPMGPCIVTTDEIPDPQNLGIRLRLNGRTMQDSTSADLIFKIPEVIAVLSDGMTLEAGDIISTGTPSGVGMGMSPPVFLKDGDVMEAEIDGIGVLRNTVRAI